MANYYSLIKEEFQITKNDIVLEDWKTIKWNTIENVDMQNDEFISSKMFATQSCQFFEIFSTDKTLLTNGEVIYLYVNCNFVAGLSGNKKIYERIKDIRFQKKNMHYVLFLVITIYLMNK